MATLCPFSVIDAIGVFVRFYTFCKTEKNKRRVIFKDRELVIGRINAGEVRIDCIRKPIRRINTVSPYGFNNFYQGYNAGSRISLSTKPVVSRIITSAAALVKLSLFF